MAKVIIFLLILYKFKVAITEEFINVNLSNYKFLTDDKPVWKNNHQVSIPTFFEELEFECNSTFPTKWVLSINPLEDNKLKDVPKILKFRSREGPKGYFTFSSKILLKFKDPRGIQLFTCQDAQDRETGFRSVAVETTLIAPTRISTIFIRDKVLATTEKIYGESKDCGLELDVDFIRRSFSCRKNGARNLVPRLVLCRNPDECNAVANTEKPSCGKSINLGCQTDCSEFLPRKDAGIIICGDGINSIALRYAVIDSQDLNSTTLVRYDESSSPSDFIHLTEATYVVYDQQKVPFICKASKYVFSRGFQWVLTSALGVSLVVEEGTEIITVNNGTYVINKTITFNMTKYGNVTKLSCLGPIWNTRESAKAESTIILRVPKMPNIKETNRTITVSSGNVTLDCTYQGDPQVKLTWLLWNRIISMDEEFFRIMHQNNTSSHFTILNVGKLAQQGRRLLRITCRVENFLGIEERLFTVTSVEPETANRILLVSVICLIIFIIVLITSGWFYLRWMRKKNLEYVKKDIKLFLEGDPNASDNDDNDVSSMAQRKPYDVDLEISFQNMEIDRKNPLGSGAYGMVLRGMVSGGRCLTKTEVAIKTLKANVEPAYFKSLLTELKVILYVGHHENIVNLLGACTERIYEMELYIILELCHNGELEKYLKNHRESFSVDSTVMKNKLNFSSKSLLMWSYQIANGMEFLALKKVIHGDLATRNVLLNDDLTAKLCDFGLSRQLYEYSQYVKKQQAPLPFRWMSIESLRDLTFSTQTDVWGYGVTLWEIFSLGEVPYPGQSWTNEFLQSLIEGFRMKKPNKCSNEIYVTMMSCWNVNPQERPTFTELKCIFQKYIKN